MYTQADLNVLVKDFIARVSTEIRVKDIYLFGSYANGVATDESDIDLAIVSDDFEGIRIDDKKRLHKFLLHSSSALELHPFKTEDFTPDNPFVEEILRTGKRIQWN